MLPFFITPACPKQFYHSVIKYYKLNSPAKAGYIEALALSISAKARCIEVWVAGYLISIRPSADGLLNRHRSTPCNNSGPISYLDLFLFNFAAYYSYSSK